MENFLELENIVLIPTETNEGYVDMNKFDPSVRDNTEKYETFAKTLPVFTSPMSSIVSSDQNVLSSFTSHGIKPILPLTEPLEKRLELCQWVFCSFSIKEVESTFIANNQKYRGYPDIQYHINIDERNGHSLILTSTCSKLKQIYGDGVTVMGGNVACPEIYSAYSRAGFDYMRVGISGGSLVDSEKYGFHYPMASLLESIKQFRRTSGIGLQRQTKVIADGGIYGPSDIVKAMALGADYVMCGRSFAHVLESAGTIRKKSNTRARGVIQNDRIDPTTLRGFDKNRLKTEGLERYYVSRSSKEVQAVLAGYSGKNGIEAWERNTNIFERISDAESCWVEIDKTLDDWVDEFQQCVYNAFLMTGTTNWNNFKMKIRYGSINL